MTNGEKMKQAFPDLQIDMGELEVYMWTTAHDAIDIPLEWWNEEYKEPNCSEIPTGSIDYISKQEVVGLMMHIWGKNFSGDDAMQECIDAIRVMPSVTPIRPKGHWIEQIDHEENCRTLICSNCDRPALHDGDSIWKHKFCPHCGADMREVEE